MFGEIYMGNSITLHSYCRPLPLFQVSQSGAGKRVNDYLNVLSSLRKVLGDTTIIPGIGVDVFPAAFARVIGLNWKGIRLSDFIENAMKACRSTLIDPDTLKKNLILIPAIDAKNVPEVKRRIKARGLLKEGERRSLFLKGFLEYLMKYDREEDRETRYEKLSRRIYLPAAAKWVTDMLCLFNKGDHVIFFDDDCEIVPYLLSSGKFRERKNVSQQTKSRAGSVLVDVEGAVSQYLLLPSNCRALEII